jgi:hypothetical protein
MIDPKDVVANISGCYVLQIEVISSYGFVVTFPAFLPVSIS